MLLPACGLSFEEVEQDLSDNDLVIAFAEVPETYSPVDYNVITRKYINNIYEPLVKFDRDFNIDTSVALSWGKLDDYTWDFKLRPDVYFHNGSLLDADDVVYSITYAKENQSSGLQGLLSGIVNVEKTEENRVQIVTAKPDPLLINRLANVYIFPDQYTSFDSPVGTGAYAVTKMESDYLKLDRFDDYWGAVPYFESVYLRYLPDPDERFEKTASGDIDILANIPPQHAASFQTLDFTLREMPSLEVSFLMLNVGGVLSDDMLRRAVYSAISDDYAQELGGGFLYPATQYAAQGISGYLGGYVGRMQNNVVAYDLRQEYGEEEVTLTLDFPEGLEILGEAVAEDLAKIDVEVEQNYWSPDEYEDYVLEGNSDMYFFGWKYDLADAADFFEAVVHTSEEGYGDYNGINFSDESVDVLIEDISVMMELSPRQNLLGNLTKVLEPNYVVVPLFESKLSYVFQNDIHWDLRIDGQLLASEMFKIVVE